MNIVIPPYLKARLAEPSTWRGIALSLTSFGILLNPSQIEAITFWGLLVTGLLGSLTPDKSVK